MSATLADELRLDGPGRVAHLSAIALLFLLTYLPRFAILHAKYSEVDSYYGHGYLIPLISGVLIWHQRQRLKALPVAPSPVGLWVLVGGLMLHLLGGWWYVNVIADVSMLVVLAGLSLYLFGRSVTRALMFPLVFLLFMIPLPKISIIYVTFWLKLFAARVATEIVDTVGIPVLLHGAFIELPNGVLEIENACSGLRSLIALTALGALVAHFLPVSRRKKVLFVLVAIPVAVTANLMRIVSLILVSYRYGPTGRAFEMADLATGLLVFAIAWGGLFVVSKGAVAWERRGATASARGERRHIRGTPAETGESHNGDAMRRYRIAAGLLLGSALLSWSVAQSDTVRYEVRLNELPMTLGPWEGRTEELTRTDLVYAVLETSAVLSRTYVTRDGRGDRIDLLITYFERGHRGFHPPEVSFVAAGNTIIRSDRVGIPLTDDATGPQLEANRFLGTTPTGDVLFLYWFSIGDDLMASYYRGSVVLLWNAIQGRPRPASMVRLALPVVGGDLERTMTTAGEFTRRLVPMLPRYLIEGPRTTPARTSQ